MSLAELRSLIARHAREDMTTPVGHVMLSSVTEPAPPSSSTTGTTFALIAQGAKSLALGNRIYEYRAGQYLVASVDVPVTGQFTEASPTLPALGFGLTLRPAVIAELLLGHAAELPLADRATAGSGVAVSDASPRLLDAVVRMVRLLDHPRDLPVLAPLIEREILWLLITGEQGATVRHLGLAESSLTRVGHAVNWIRDHYADAIRVDELASISRMSPSAFHRSFQAVTAMSPIQFQKQIRLQEARILLMSAPREVARTAFAVGYESASQFSREYRRQFGAPPGQDAARLRPAGMPRT
ncbi:AraC family transcriptional regulator [soil metagenome]